MQAINQNQATLLVNGMIYGGWKSIVIERHIDHIATRFNISVSERWAGQSQMWQITPFSPAVIKIGGDVVLTGYVDEYQVNLSGDTHSVTIIGRSKTCDLIDCTPDIAGGQYKSYTLEQIARAVCALFKIGVVIQTPARQVFPDATLQRGETGLAFLERLARLSGVLLTDDENGNLVLTTAGFSRAIGTLVQGQNVLAANFRLNVDKRFSQYIIKGQHAIGSATAANSALAALGTAGGALALAAPVLTNMRAVSTDTGVPRYRPRIALAEAQLDQAGMNLRANWERNYAFGRACEAEITVLGWRQPDGSLWKVNQLVTVTCPALQANQDLLIAGVTFRLDDGGSKTVLRVGPVEGFTPDPGQVKLHTKRGKPGATASVLDGLGVSS